MCALYDSTEFKKAVFIVAALLRQDDGLLREYIQQQFFPVSHLRLFSCRQRATTSSTWRTILRPLTLAEFTTLYDCR